MDNSDISKLLNSGAYVSPVGGTTSQGTTTKTEAPTNAQTFANLQEQLKPPSLSEGQLAFVTLVDMYWSQHSEFPTAQLLYEQFGLPMAKYQKYFTTPQVRDALKERSVRLPDEDNWKTKGLTPLQVLTINKMLDVVDNRNEKKKLQDLGVTTTQWKRWLQDPVFKKYLQARAENLLGEHQHDAHLALVDRVRSGDTNALKLYFNYTGLYRDDQGANLNLPALLTRILEIIIEEIEDHSIVDRISERLMGLGQATNIAAGMTAPTLEVADAPEVMPQRARSPELQAAIDHGVGVNI